MSIKSVNKIKDKIKNKKDDRQRSVSEIDFINTSHRIKEEYLDRYEGVKSEILSTTRFNENSDLSTTYLGKTSINKDNKIATEEKFSISEQGYTTGKLLNGTHCQILLDTRDSKSFMYKSHYLHCKSLHSLPKFASKTQRIQVGNGQYVSILFVIPIIVDIHGHRFEIYTLIYIIHKNIDTVLGIKNVLRLEGVISLQECCFSFLNRSIPLFLKEKIILKPKEPKLVKIEAPFVDFYVRQCLSICTILLELSRGTVSCILLFIGCTVIHNAHLQVQ